MRGSVTALLGPTNTGKTYIALERMLTHRTGMIGFPLRLLARENYDRVVALRGREAVALVTGEERIVPKAPSYFICTVEAMPVDRGVDFLAIDEVQLAADRERGHVFTDRLLHARGRIETWLVGAATLRPLVKSLVPEAGILTRPRLSTLRYLPPRRLRNLPRRTAVVVFSLAELYTVAEALRHETGGVALVFGALSPRTRNAQVALFQAGEVDYLVATDAIGMGLNLDVDHVAFTSLIKFDGVGARPLRADEIAQVAGRAGRHVKDGTFGPTEELGDFEPRLVESLEAHRFPPLPTIYWRNSELDFRSPEALLRGLEAAPPRRELVRAPRADDHRVFAVLSADPALTARLASEENVTRLWEVCQVPDFQAVMTDAHARLLSEVFSHLTSPARRLPEDWVEPQVRRLERADGDAFGLLFRIAAIRTWTYIAHRPGWLADPEHWQERTRAIEDRLSDALHDRLTEQFVDRRATVIARHEPGELIIELGEDHEVLVQGLLAGRLDGFRFIPEPGVHEKARPLLAAANRGLRASIRDRVAALAEGPSADLAVATDGRILWRGQAIGRLANGESIVAPQVEVLPSDLLDAPLRETIRRRLSSFVEAELRLGLRPLLALREAELSGPARGLAFALSEGLGSVPRGLVADQLVALLGEDRRRLSKLGVTFGRLSVFMPALLRPEAIRRRVSLLAARRAAPLGPRPDGAPSLPKPPSLDLGFYSACGYQAAGPLLVRVDLLDRIATDAQRRAARGPFRPDPKAAAWLGCSPETVPAVLQGLGYLERGGLFEAPRRERPPRRARA